MTTEARRPHPGKFWRVVGLAGLWLGLASTAVDVQAWGADGHRLIAEVAGTQLSGPAHAEIDACLRWSQTLRWNRFPLGPTRAAHRPLLTAHRPLVLRQPTPRFELQLREPSQLHRGWMRRGGHRQADGRAGVERRRRRAAQSLEVPSALRCRRSPAAACGVC